MFRGSRLQQGDIVSHFKRYSVDPNSNTYLYKILCIAYDQQNKKQVVYQALYAPFKVWIREYEEFMAYSLLKTSLNIPIVLRCIDLSLLIEIIQIKSYLLFLRGMT